MRRISPLPSGRCSCRRLSSICGFLNPLPAGCNALRETRIQVGINCHGLNGPALNSVPKFCDGSHVALARSFHKRFGYHSSPSLPLVFRRFLS